MRPRCSERRARCTRGKLTVRLVVAVGDHPSVGFSVAGVLLGVVGELQAARASLREVGLSLQGLPPGPEVRT